MNIHRLIAGLAAAAAALVLLTAPVSAQGVNTTILLYDEDGRVIGVRQGDAGEGEPAAATDDDDDEAEDRAAPRPPAERTRRGRGNDDPANRFEPNELLVANAPEGFAADARRLGFRIIERVPLRALDMDLLRLSLPGRLTPEEALEVLRSNFPSLLTDVNTIFEPGAANRPASLAREIAGWSPASASCGEGIRIGIIDGVVDVDHPALKGQRVEFQSFIKERSRPGAASHGTAIATMMVGVPADKGWGGLLPGAQLFAGNMFEARGRESVGNTVAMLRALEWLIEKKVHVVNLSIAGGDNTLMRLAFKKARLAGIVAVAAAGNWGSADKPAFPAALEETVAVTAVNKDMLIYKHANRGGYVDFSAPGVRVWTAFSGGGKFQSGTSFATPFIATVIAVAVARGVPPDAKELRRLLRRKVFDLGAPGRDDVFGFGIVVGEPRCG